MSSERLSILLAPPMAMIAAVMAVFGDAGMLGETVFLSAALAAAPVGGLVLGFAAGLLLPRLGAVILALVVAASCETIFGIWVRAYNFAGDHLTYDAGLAGAMAWITLTLPGVVVLVMGRRAPAAIAVAGAVFSLGVLVLPANAERVPALIPQHTPTGPLGRVIVHIMLDEHIGPVGIPADIPGGIEARRQIEGFYTGNGFRLYSNAKSISTATELSLADLLHLAGDDADPSETFSRWHGQMRWFALLKNDGYRVMAYSIGGLFNICSTANRPVIDVCRVYSSDAVALRMWPDHRLRYLFTVFAARSMIIQTVCRHLAQCPALMIEYNMTSAAVLDSVAQTIASADGDVAIFAHVLLPHGPQLLDAECRAEPNSALIASNAEEHFPRYFAQIACTRLKIDAILEALKARGALDRATVIVHGDHGLRSNSTRPDEQYPPAISQSTLFAVRAPGIAPGIDPRPATVQELLPIFARDAVGQPEVGTRR